MTTQPLKASVIAKVAEDYRRRGYDVDVEPSGPSLPEFLGEYRPDLIARGSAETVVVGVKVGTQMSVAERLRDVVEQINRQPGWRFSLVFVNPEHPDQLTEAKPAPLPLLEERAKTADDLFQADQKEAAFLLLWSAVEGTLRFAAFQSAAIRSPPRHVLSRRDQQAALRTTDAPPPNPQSTGPRPRIPREC